MVSPEDFPHFLLYSAGVAPNTPNTLRAKTAVAHQIQPLHLPATLASHAARRVSSRRVDGRKLWGSTTLWEFNNWRTAKSPV